MTLLICIPLEWQYIQDENYAILAAQCCESEAILSKKNSVWPGPRAGVFVWEHFHPGFRDLGNLASPASRIYEHIDIFTKKRVASEISETEPALLTGLL